MTVILHKENDGHQNHMNNRDYKKFSAGNYFHIFNRGNAKQKIFLEEQDYKIFIYRLRENLFPELIEEKNKISPSRYHRQIIPKGSFTLISYCLMPNHFHLLLRQNTDLALTDLLKKVCVGYVKYFNKKYERVGGLFEHKFRSVHLSSNEYLLWLSAYIHQNPQVGNLVSSLNDWPYSSYLDYVGKRAGTLCDKNIVIGQFKNAQDYERFVEGSYEKILQMKQIRNLLIDE